MRTWDPHELCKLDDLCTGLILDPKMNLVTHKMNVRHRPDRQNWAKLKQILDEFQLCSPSVAGYYSHTLKKLKEDVPGWWRQFENGTDDTKNRIKNHIFLYLKMWDPTSGYSIRECTRYSKDGIDGRGGTLFATRPYKRGDKISELKGCIGEMSHEQQRAILVEGKNDYSVQYSTSKRKYHLWLGPAAFLNHDCKPNAKIQSTGNHSASVYAIGEIKNDDEILIFYGKDFFEVGNTECECRTCERRQQGKFKSNKEDDRKSGSSPLKAIGKYGLRETESRKRRAETGESPIVTDIRIQTQRRKVGPNRTERLTQVNIRQSVQDSANSDTSDSDHQPREIRLKYKDGSNINLNLGPSSSRSTRSKN